MTNTRFKLDARQEAIKKINPLYERYLDRIVEWTTYFRANMDKYAELYFGLKLYPYQRYIVRNVNRNRQTCIVGSRYTAKTFDGAIAACCKASLYPNSIVIIVAGSKKQARLSIDKIRILKRLSPMLRREIKDIKDNENQSVVYFSNGSVIKAIYASRGERSTFTIYDEFREIKENVRDTVIVPYAGVRQTPYKDFPEYADLIEEPSELYMSSAWFASHWMSKIIYADNTFLIGLDLSVVIKHKFKTVNQLLAEKQITNSLSWRMEYLNEMVREDSAAYFTYGMFTANQQLKKAFYPKLRNKIKKMPSEIRIVACDMAFSGGDKNDNSIFSCMRLLPETFGTVEGFSRQTVGMEGHNGGEILEQAIRIRQLFEDFEADYLVLDVRNAGIAILDLLGKNLYDEQRDKEYEPWKCMNDDDLASRCKIPSAQPVIFAISATQKLNSDIANSMKLALNNGKMKFLISPSDAEPMLQKIPEYVNAIEADVQLAYEEPYLQTQEFINECIGLQYEKKEQTGIIVIRERGGNRKDRYTSVSYGNYFADKLEMDLLSSTENEFIFLT